MNEPMALELDASIRRALGGRSISLGDLDAIRLMLRGNSVIDWNRAHFNSIEEVDRFLRLHLLDMSNVEDQRRLRYVHGEAVNYLRQHLGLQFPPDLTEPVDVREIFLLASQTGGFRRRQIHACVILKLMHVLAHMDAAELRFQTRLSEAEVLDLAEKRIVGAAAQMRAAGFPLVAFYGSRKTRNSIITKLLAKKENTAVTIFDKLRFRLVTEEKSHILPALAWLCRELFPFHYVIPGQSHNNLVDLDGLLEHPSLHTIRDEMQRFDRNESEGGVEDNPFSGNSYRMINFIVDFPVRVPDECLPQRGASVGHLLGRTVFALVELQVIDRETARTNEEGENAHHHYKDRQRAIVESRLRKGGRKRRLGLGASSEG